MKKNRILLLVSLFIMASLLLLKLEKKEMPITGYQSFLKDTTTDANIILQTYGASIYKIDNNASAKTKNSFLLETKIYSATSNNHPVLHYRCDSSLSVTIYSINN
jgi:hypothetical protein